MTTRSEREKAQKLNEQHQAILSKMLREEDNKYCADCEAKGATLTLSRLFVFSHTQVDIFTHGPPLTLTNNVASAVLSSAGLTRWCVSG